MIPESAYETHRLGSEGLTPEEQIEHLAVPKGEKYRIGNHPLDKNPLVEKHFRMVISWWNYERVKQFDNRAERMRAHDFVDMDQWTEEEKAELEERGQYPFVFNMIKSTQDYLTGTERRMRADYQVLPRRKDDGKSAEEKTKLLKYINNINKARFARSLAFKDQAISGLGWRDVGVKTDETEDPIYCRYEDWRNVWHDSCAKQWDLSDGRYLFRTRIVDYDVAVAMFPDRADAIRAHINAHGDILIDEFDEASLDPELEELAGEDNTVSSLGVRRERVRLIQCEYRVPERVKVVKGQDLGSLNGSVFDKKNEALQKLIDSGYASLVESTRMVMYRMIFCGRYVLQWGRRPFNHNRFSLIPQWCYRRKKDGMPYGVVLPQMDPQIDLNKRRAKAMWHLSSNQMIIEKDNWDDYDELVEEKDRPDGVMVVKSVTGIELRDYTKSQMTAEHVRMMDQDREFIESTGGVNDEARGVQTNAASGKAIRARQDQTNVNTTEIFDNALHSFQLEGEILLSLAEQYYTEERTIRITGKDGKPEYEEINKRGKDGMILNDITATQCDFVVDAQNHAATIRQAMFEQFGDMVSRMPPEIAIQLIDIWFDLSDLPGREAAVQRIRKINGQNDPDEDPESPEAQARAQAEQQEAEQQKQIQDMMIKLEMALKEAQGKKETALAEKAIADAQATMASIKQKAEEIRIKKAQTLNTIETQRRQAMMPEQKQPAPKPKPKA
jgi:hypothetical protein